MSAWRVIEADALAGLRGLGDGSVQTCVTSPPYFCLRDYGHDGQIGLEPTPDEYVARLVEVFREVRRVLRDDGTLWLNLGDSYYSPTATQGRNENRSAHSFNDGSHGPDGRSPALDAQTSTSYRRDVAGLKPKDLLGIPWMVAFALRADGWYLRSDIIWAKPNPMPESVTDRPTKAHEYLFLLSKCPRYFYDADAVREDAQQPLGDPQQTGQASRKQLLDSVPGYRNGESTSVLGSNQGSPYRNKRSVWTVATTPFPGAHFAVFPPKLIEPCILAGSSDRACGECGAPWQRVQTRDPDEARTATSGTMTEAPTTRTVGWEPSCDHDDGSGSCTVLDPFCGSGTTGLVALRHHRSFVGIELNPEYVELARNRIRDDAPLLNSVSEAA